MGARSARTQQNCYVYMFQEVAGNLWQQRLPQRERDGEIRNEKMSGNFNLI